ncbi:MAG TPA: Uma2 family endonuclease [Thermodesulfovibrionia bacterium]|nr:Uma2 family endonuclease [Thermodesulfovibrionia bacterium]
MLEETTIGLVPQVHLWTRHDYYKMAEAGLFEGKHVELIKGQVIEMSPMGSLHATAVALCARILEHAFGQGYFTRWQMPLDAGEHSEPEPDIAVIQGSVRQFKNAHPQTAVLIVEVAETSLTYDRTEKASLYAKVNIPDYWILNLHEQQLEVHRYPVPDSSQLFGFGYADVTILKEDDFVSPIVKPGLKISVAELLP